MSYPKYSGAWMKHSFKVELWTKGDSLPAEGHTGQMLLHLGSSHKSHHVEENENKLFSNQVLLQHHSDLSDPRCKAIHRHCSLKIANYTPGLQAAEDKKREGDDLQMAKDNISQVKSKAEQRHTRKTFEGLLREQHLPRSVWQEGL